MSFKCIMASQGIREGMGRDLEEQAMLGKVGPRLLIFLARLAFSVLFVGCQSVIHWTWWYHLNL